MQLRASSMYKDGPDCRTESGSDFSINIVRSRNADFAVPSSLKRKTRIKVRNRGLGLKSGVARVNTLKVSLYLRLQWRTQEYNHLSIHINHTLNHPFININAKVQWIMWTR
jgi:hypothetical protein